MHICTDCNVILEDLPDVKYIGKIPQCPKEHGSKRVGSFWLPFALGVICSIVLLLAGSMNPLGMSPTGALLIWLLPFVIIFGGALLSGLRYFRKPEPTRRLAKQNFGLALGMLLPLIVGIIRAVA